MILACHTGLTIHSRMDMSVLSLGLGMKQAIINIHKTFESIIFISVGQMSRSTVAMFMVATYLFLRLTYFIPISVLYYMFKMYLLYWCFV